MKFSLLIAASGLLLALPGGPTPAAPDKAATIITSPVAAAKTFQVTETFYNCGGRFTSPTESGSSTKRASK